MDQTLKGKSTLNPNATPFMPSSFNPNPPLVQYNNPPQVSEGAQESTNLTTEHNLPNNILYDFDEGLTDEQRVVENISCMYPDIPWDFIHEFAGAHGFDFDLTVDMLEQFYVPQAETSQSQSDVHLDSPNTKPSSST